NKMELMEKQLEALTDLVKELTNPIKSRTLLDMYDNSLHQQLYELKVKTHTLRNDLFSIRRMQQSLQENFKNELERANKKIREQFERLNQNEKTRHIEHEFDLYVNNRSKIDQDLEDLELTVEELQNDVKFKQCYVTINDVESFALVLSTISRSLVDLKTSFPILREKLSTLDEPSIIKFLNEEPERLDFTIKKCKRLTTMLYQLKQLAINQEHKPARKVSLNINKNSADRKRLLEEIQSVTLNSEERIKSIEKAEKLRERRLYYDYQLEILKKMKSNSDQMSGHYDNRSLTNSLSTRTSICSTDSNNCSSPSSSYVLRQASMNSSIINDSKTRLQSSIKPPSKVTFSQQLITNEKSSFINKKSKPNPPVRIQSTPSSSIVSSTSSSSSSSTSGNSRFCGIIPLLSVDRRLNGRCYSFSSSSTDTDSIISDSHKTTKLNKPKSHQPTLMRASVTDLYSNNDYNRVLAKQPRQSADIPIFRVDDNLQLHPLNRTLSIADIVRISQLKKKISDNFDEQSNFQLNQTETQSVQSNNFSPVIDYQRQEKQPQPQQQQQQQQKSSPQNQLTIRNSLYSFQPNFEMFNQIMNHDAVVIGRASMNLNNYQRFNNNHTSLHRPSRGIVEHNGKQFITEFKERIEHRYVQIFDEYLGQIRVFEVTDYIPTRVIRPMRNRIQYPLHKRSIPGRISTTYPLTQVSTHQPMIGNGTELARSSNPVNSREPINRDTRARENDQYNGGSSTSYDKNNNSAHHSNNNNNPNTRISNGSQAQTINNDASDKYYSPAEYPDSKPSSSISQPIKRAPPEYSPGSYRSPSSSLRSHTPSSSNYSINSSGIISKNFSNYTGSQGADDLSSSYNGDLKNNRTNTIAYAETTAGYNSPAPIDPFAKTVRTGEHHYVKRPGINNYSQPTMINQNFQSGVTSDYAPIATSYKKSNQNQYNFRKD
ncbi:unnamed protein product, partial [Rotaria magnacalcarata]